MPVKGATECVICEHFFFMGAVFPSHEQREDLPRILTTAVSLLAPVAEAGLDSRMSPQAYEAISLFLSVAEKALSWSFTPKDVRPGVFDEPTEPATTLHPPATWSELFNGDRSLVDLFFSVCERAVVTLAICIVSRTALSGHWQPNEVAPA